MGFLISQVQYKAGLHHVTRMAMAMIGTTNIVIDEVNEDAKLLAGSLSPTGTDPPDEAVAILIPPLEMEDEGARVVLGTPVALPEESIMEDSGYPELAQESSNSVVRMSAEVQSILIF